MPKVKLTHRSIANLTVGKWLTDYYDENLDGFAVRVHHSGKKAYVLRYSADGKRRRMTLGKYPAMRLADARDKAKLLGQIQDGATVNVAVLPEWHGIRQQILEALRPYPEARLAVVQALRGDGS